MSKSKFAPGRKNAIVKEYLSGQGSYDQIAKAHKISKPTLRGGGFSRKTADTVDGFSGASDLTRTGDLLITSDGFAMLRRFVKCSNVLQL